jgi:hypothetical protein
MQPGFEDSLYELIGTVIQPGDEIDTLSIKHPNEIAEFDRSGIWVNTERSKGSGAGPQHVPAWMIAIAWEGLCANGELSQVEVLNDLNVKRSAFVCALLALFPDVVVRQTRPTVLELVRSPA